MRGTRLKATSPLSNNNRVRNALGKILLDDRIDLRAAEANTRGIKNAITTTQEEDLACRRVVLNEITMRPHVVEMPKIRVEILLVPRIAPEHHRHVGERLGRHEFSGDTVWYGDALDARAALGAVVYLEADCQRWSLTTSHVNGREWVVYPETA